MHRQEQVIDGTGLVVGAGTASYGFLNDITTVAESIGIIAGATLTVLILIHWVYTKAIRPLFKRGDQSSHKETES